MQRIAKLVIASLFGLGMVGCAAPVYKPDTGPYQAEHIRTGVAGEKYQETMGRIDKYSYGVRAIAAHIVVSDSLQNPGSLLKGSSAAGSLGLDLANIATGGKVLPGGVGASIVGMLLNPLSSLDVEKQVEPVIRNSYQSWVSSPGIVIIKIGKFEGVNDAVFAAKAANEHRNLVLFMAKNGIDCGKSLVNANLLPNIHMGNDVCLVNGQQVSFSGLAGGSINPIRPSSPLYPVVDTSKYNWTVSFYLNAAKAFNNDLARYNALIEKLKPQLEPDTYLLYNMPATRPGEIMVYGNKRDMSFKIEPPKFQ